MAKRKALLFDRVESFCDFIRTHGGGARSKTGYSLYRVAAPDQLQSGIGQADQSWLVLFGYHPRRKLLGSQTFERLEVVEKNDSLLSNLKAGGACTLPIQSRSQGRTLSEFIALAPWQSPRRDERQIVMFWLRKPELLARLVSDSMALRNDRIRYAAVKSAGRKEMLVRIEAPSVYLLQLCQESFAKDVDLYYPGSDCLFLPWGHDYPLIDLWEKHRSASSDADAGNWRFFSVDGAVKSMAPIQWEDVYDASEFEFATPCESHWLQDDQAEHRIRLTLRNEKRNRPAQPEMWMLVEEQQSQLESLLSAVDESDLENLVLSIQRDDKGQQLFFVREKHTSRKRKYFEFSGQRLATYKGYPNLFLPADCELQPQLRRDQYPQFFELKTGELTIMLPGDDDRNGRLLRLNERSFKPLRNYIDYLIEGDRELLEDVMMKSVFDFGKYANAPKRPDLSQRKNEAKSSSGSQQPKKPGGSLERTGEVEAGQTSSEASTPRKGQVEESWKVEPRSDLEKEEQELESKLVSDLPTPGLWEELLQIKANLEKHGAAAQCAVEALWMSEPGPDSDRIREQWSSSLSRSADARGLEERQPAQVASWIHDGPQLAGGDASKLNAWLQQAIAEMRETESQFRVKDQWLLWGELLKHNRDHVEQARVREQLLNQLGSGLSREEIPDFIRAALLRTGLLDEKSGTDFADAATNLRGIEDWIQRVESNDLRQPTLAMTARAYSRIGLLDRTRTLCEQLQDSNSMQTLARCLVSVFAHDALKSIDEAQARRYSERLQRHRQHLPSDEAATLIEIEQSLAERSDAENVAELLSAENYRLFFPTGGGQDVDQQLEEVTNRFLAGESIDFDDVFSIVNGWLEEKGMDKQRLALRTRQLVQELLTRMQWGIDGPRMVAAYEQLIDRATKRYASRREDFYEYLLGVAFAQGLIQLGQETRAAELMKQPIQQNNLALLDTIDVCSARLTVIESMPLRERGTMLTMLLECLTQGVSGLYVTHSLRVLDQTIEAAVSKDKFAAQKLQQYIDHEEFMIRQRVLSEDFCQTTEPTP